MTGMPLEGTAYRVQFLDTPAGFPIYFDPQSDWLRHGPFGMWLVGALRPRRIVELGTHNGYSYFAFCEAVRQHGLRTRCVAVDAWAGDAHAGFCGDEVYAAVCARNAPYAAFSTLLRKSFDAALADVADGSVDLLHIDGRHFYADVKADHQNWLPKLSPRAVVLFHNTEVRERGFGVWRYWAEISRSRPSFSFVHQNGLGVLFHGPEIDGPLSRFVDRLQAEGGAAAVRTIFERAGEESVQLHLRTGVAGPRSLPAPPRPVERGGRTIFGGPPRRAPVGALRRWRAIATYRVLATLSRAAPLLPARTRQRLARSARKRDPLLWREAATGPDVAPARPGRTEGDAPRRALLPAGRTAERKSGAPRRILYIEDRVPLQIAGAGLPRATDMLRMMTEAGFFVTFLPAIVPEEDRSAILAAMPEGAGEIEVAMGVGLEGLETFLSARPGFYDHVLVSRPHNMERFAAVVARRPDLLQGARVTYDAEAIFASRDLAKAELTGDAALREAAWARERAELALAAHAHHVTAVNAAEAARFRTPGGPAVSILGHALKPDATPAGFDARRHVLFMGNLADPDSPNVDSLIWFVDEVMPRLADLFRGPARLLVAGRNDAAAVRARRGGRVELLGPVDDLRVLFDRARVFVAPTRFAAGIPHKVHQAAALGVPVVATSLLARQLGWQDGRHLLVADTPGDFGAAVARLYRDPVLWQELREAALAQVTTDCDPDAFRAVLLQAVNPDAEASRAGSS